MINKNVCFFFVVFLMLMYLKGNSQIIGVGADAMYNFQTESVGAGARVNFFPNNKLSFVPEFSYYFAFNKVSEYFLGMALEYKFIRREKVNFYAILHGAYDQWLNYESSPLTNAHATNWDLEGGIGVSTNTCLRPFLEYRYNIRFEETHLRLGLLYIFGCKHGGGGGRYHKERCDAYNTN